ncbi:Qat anti-phage system QueC-like protein QatC [Clostridium sp. JS66]|uniref:Qat anti-phage system QueC-like protein QatC n=1 Tax=Clostridium sp. JS66 TaxID=3064705 RepID=UPI00298EB714|nr:Qat anti-phage system QueC-like protein QatC [Clostridium sp. JS66]WPC42848.1 Qat anti-phage system QueC-like protein QatC [Clostridium sp. JS66]
MNIWINKCKKEIMTHEFVESYIFDLNNKNNKSNIKNNIQDLWRRFGLKEIKSINEDLLIIALSIFAVDKRVPRKLFSDSWTRVLKVSIPVIDIDKWNNVKVDIEKLLGYLSGDIWILNFRKSNERYRNNKINKNYNVIKDKEFDCVSLFSGGLDSFSGAVKLLEENKKVCFIGFREYGLLAGRQNQIYSILNSEYEKIKKELILFNGTPYSLLDKNNSKSNFGVENTSRSRSFLFLSGALAVASIIGDNVPVYIPENGFIGLNVPLTMSRKGSCSTRTTHPYFIKNFNKILSKIGIKNTISNFYSFKTKGEIVQEVCNTKAFKNGANLTISCSHPCQARYDGETPPMNCGYCYPCLIRKASMNKINFLNEVYNPKNNISKQFIDENNRYEGKASDLKAVLYSINRYINNKDDKSIEKLILKSGKLSNDELEKYKRLYKLSIEELINMIKSEAEKNGNDLLKYTGIVGEQLNE